MIRYLRGSARPSIACIVTAAASMAFTVNAQGSGIDRRLGAEAARLCQGVPATVIGTPRTDRLAGTSGDDVIITAGARIAEALDGDDLVCVTRLTQYVAAGGGDDSVTTGDRQARTSISLDAGTDTFIGGARHDSVDGGTGADNISTGNGPDHYSEWSPTPDNDQVRLGPGNDYASVASDDRLSGGSGLNTLNLACCQDVDQPLVVDNRAEVAIFDGKKLFHWVRFRGFHFDAWYSPERVVFEGTDAAEQVTASQEFEYGPTVDELNLRGGNDEVVLNGLLAPVAAGEGNDWLRVVGFADERSLTLEPGPLSVDLGDGWLRLGEDNDRTLGVTDVENVEVDGFITAEVSGDDQPNQLIAGQSCLARMQGHGGPDLITARPQAGGCSARTAEYFDVPRSVRADGGAGYDLLRGRETPDRLNGGPGIDTVDGRGSTDACTGELRLHCER
ncbi:MAG TPA: calcium-binding protein [Thermomicrobiales bacterium]|nr:calcium-binding protein [Thermomicrobiales bacterium]